MYTKTITKDNFLLISWVVIIQKFDVSSLLDNGCMHCFCCSSTWLVINQSLGDNTMKIYTVINKLILQFKFNFYYILVT